MSKSKVDRMKLVIDVANKIKRSHAGWFQDRGLVRFHLTSNVMHEAYLSDDNSDVKLEVYERQGRYERYKHSLSVSYSLKEYLRRIGEFTDKKNQKTT